jgi:hypothetical protein
MTINNESTNRKQAKKKAELEVSCVASLQKTAEGSEQRTRGTRESMRVLYLKNLWIVGCFVGRDSTTPYEVNCEIRSLLAATPSGVI